MTLSQRAEFNSLRERYIADLKPAGPEQENMVEHIARVAWIMRTVQRRELEIFDSMTHPGLDTDTWKALDALSKLEERYFRAFHSAIRLFLMMAKRDAVKRKSRASGHQKNDNR